MLLFTAVYYTKTFFNYHENDIKKQSDFNFPSAWLTYSRENVLNEKITV